MLKDLKMDPEQYHKNAFYEEKTSPNDYKSSSSMDPKNVMKAAWDISPEEIKRMSFEQRQQHYHQVMHDRKLQLDTLFQTKIQYEPQNRDPLQREYQQLLTSDEEQYHRLLAELDAEQEGIRKGKQPLRKRYEEEEEDVLAINNEVPFHKYQKRPGEGPSKSSADKIQKSAAGNTCESKNQMIQETLNQNNIQNPFPETEENIDCVDNQPVSDTTASSIRHRKKRKGRYIAVKRQYTELNKYVGTLERELNKMQKIVYKKTIEGEELKKQKTDLAWQAHNDMEQIVHENDQLEAEKKNLENMIDRNQHQHPWEPCSSSSSNNDNDSL